MELHISWSLLAMRNQINASETMKRLFFSEKLEILTLRLKNV